MFTNDVTKPISRVLVWCTHLSLHGVAAACSGSLAPLPPVKTAGPANPSLVGVASDRVYIAAQSPVRWWALTSPFHPYRRKQASNNTHLSSPHPRRKYGLPYLKWESGILWCPLSPAVSFCCTCPRVASGCG